MQETLEALLLGVKRSIEVSDLNGKLTGEAIIPDVAISEMHSDEVTVTTHPVDTGAQISDHAIRQPAVVICTFGWSNSSRLINSVLDGSIFKGLETVKDVYQKLLEIKDSRQPVKLSTAKRVYDTVLITKIETTTTVDTENAAVIEVTFEEILTANARTETLEAIKQKNPEQTASVKNMGQKNAVPSAAVQLQGGALNG